MDLLRRLVERIDLRMLSFEKSYKDTNVNLRRVTQVAARVEELKNEMETMKREITAER